jgi:hypothetical protein
VIGCEDEDAEVAEGSRTRLSVDECPERAVFMALRGPEVNPALQSREGGFLRASESR